MNSPTKASEPTLTAQLLTTDRTGPLVADCTRLVETRVRKASGLKGVALRSGLSMLESAKPGIVPRAVARLLPEFVGALEPLYADYRSGAGHDARDGGFGTWLQVHRDAAVRALMTLADDRSAASRNTAFRAFYGKMRGVIEREAQGALPAIANRIDAELHRPAVIA